MMKKILILSGLVVLVTSTCSKKSPLEVEPYSLRLPVKVPLIQRQDLRTDQDFSTGYINGNIRSDRIFMCWERVEDQHFLAYKIFRNGENVKTISDNRETCAADSNLVPGRYYFYKVAAVLKNGAAKTDTITLKTPHLLSPTNPDYEYISESSIRLFWENRMESANRFIVSQRQGADNFEIRSTVPDTFFVDDSVRVGESYEYKIIPKSRFETGDSGFVTVNIQKIFDSPTITGIEQLPGSRSVRIQWDDNANSEMNYWVYRDGLIISKLDANSTFFVDNDTTNSLQVGETYRYIVEITDRDGRVRTSGESQITIIAPEPPVFSRLFHTASVKKKHPVNSHTHRAARVR